jgi:hypothetical protein
MTLTYTLQAVAAILNKLSPFDEIHLIIWNRIIAEKPAVAQLVYYCDHNSQPVVFVQNQMFKSIKTFACTSWHTEYFSYPAMNIREWDGQSTYLEEYFLCASETSRKVHCGNIHSIFPFHFQNYWDLRLGTKERRVKRTLTSTSG